MKTNSAFALAVIVMTAFAFAAFGREPQDADRAEAPLAVKELVVFKNGDFFAARDGTVRVDDGVFRCKWVPEGALGTIKFYAQDPGARLDYAVAREKTVTTEKQEPVGDFAALLKLNVGKPAAIITHAGMPMNGKILSVSTSSGGIVVLDTGTNICALSVGNVRSVRFGTDEGAPEVVIAGKREHTTRQKELVLRFADPAGAPFSGEVNVGVTYLAEGIRWIPGYTVNLVDDEKAAIRLQAELINDVAECTGATVRFVVGVPSFVTARWPSPLSLVAQYTGLSSFFRETGQRARMYAQQFASNVVMAQGGMAGPGSPESPEAGPGGEVPGDIVGASEMGDLFVYTKEDVSLEKGDRAVFLLFEDEVGYSHVYKHTATGFARMEPGTMRRRMGQTQAAFKQAEAIVPDLKTSSAVSVDTANPDHVIRMKNTTAVPWTTGPALVLSEGNPLGQNSILYTSVGGICDLRVTKATDIVITRVDGELSRQYNAERFSGYDYHLVSGKGVFSIKNYKDTDAHLILTRRIEGKISEVSDGGSAGQEMVSEPKVNPMTVARWEFDVPAGETKSVTYDFSYYFR